MELAARDDTRATGFYVTGKKGFQVTFENGWTVSVQFGPGNYSDNYDRDIGRDDEASGRDGSACAEVAVIGPTGLVPLDDGDTVRGWQTPAAVLALMVATASGDVAVGNIPRGERH